MITTSRIPTLLLCATCVSWLSVTGCEPSLRIDPTTLDRSRALQQQAMGAAARGDSSEYLTSIRQAAGLRPGHPGLLYHLARAYVANARFEDASAVLDTLVRMGVTANLGDDAAFDAFLAFDPGSTKAGALLRAGEPTGNATLAFTAGDSNFLPEGIAFDAGTGAFYLGSVHRRLILRVDRERADTFATADAELWGVMGMVVDDRRRTLWIATSAVREAAGVDPADVGRAAVVEMDLETGTVRRRVEAPDDGALHWFGDLFVTDSGDVYVSDSRRPAVYLLAAHADSLQPLVVGAPLSSPQGLTVMGDGTVYVADYALGVLRLDPGARSLSPLAFPPRTTVLGIDGLYAHGHDLIAIQNGVPPARVVRLGLSSNGRRITFARTLETHEAGHGEPTLGVIVADTLFYVANSEWGRFSSGMADGSGNRP